MASVSLPSEGKMSEIADVSLPISEESEMSVVSLPSQETTFEIASVYLPQFILLKSAEAGYCSPNLLGCVRGNPDSQKNYVKFYAERVGMLEARFEVHRSATGNGLVHIRNCYNNRYLVLNDNNDMIVAKAETTEDDPSKRSCTLFRPSGSASTIIRLTNVHLEKRLTFWRQTGPDYGCLMAYYRSDEKPGVAIDAFRVIDWNSLVILPRYVAFHNAAYLKALYHHNLNYLQFKPSTVTEDPLLVAHEVIQTNSSHILIRSLFWKKYWVSRGEWIRAESDTPNNGTAAFEPIKLSDDTIALKHGKLFCKRLSRDKKTNVLAADVSTVTPEARLKVVEVVSSRTISNYDFHLMNARVYNETVDTMSENTYRNSNSTPEKHTYNLKRRQEITTTWSSSISMSMSMKISFRMGIPIILEGKASIGATISGEYTWGKTTVNETTTDHGYEITVQPGKKLTMRMVATHGVCDVPFSYTQQDVLYTGEKVTQVMDDGIFIGANFYNYDLQSREEPLVKSLGNIEDEPEWKTVAKLSPSGEIIPIEVE